MNYIARGYMSLSEEHHRSRSPALSHRVRARISFFFFLLSSSSVPFLRPGPPYSRRARLSMRESFLSMVTRACYVANIVCRDLRQVIIEYLSRLFYPSPLFLSLRLPTFLNIFLALSRAINGEKLFLSIVAFRRCS